MTRQYLTYLAKLLLHPPRFLPSKRTGPATYNGCKPSRRRRLLRPARRSHQKDEIQAYFELPQRPVADPLLWWIVRKDEYPRLAKMALDYLTIPSTACECERCFSRTKLTIGTQRHSLRAETIEILACLKIWIRNRRCLKTQS